MPDAATIWTYMAYVMAGMFFLLLAYIIITYRDTTKALKLYADHIKATMELPEVKNFIETYRRPKIEVGEDPTRRMVIVRWYVKEFNKENPSVLIYVDKNSKKPLKIETR